MYDGWVSCPVRRERQRLTQRSTTRHSWTTQVSVVFISRRVVDKLGRNLTSIIFVHFRYLYANETRDES